MIPLASGECVPASALVDRQFEVMAWREDGTQVPRSAQAAWGPAEGVWHLSTRSGRHTVRDARQRLWKATAVTYKKNGRDLFDSSRGGTRVRVPEVDGWTRISQLQPGDLVLVPEKHEAEGEIRTAEHFPKLLGYLLGDGGTTKASAITFTQKNGPALDEFRELMDILGCRLNPTSRPYNFLIRNLDTSHRRRSIGSGRWNPVSDLVREWGLDGKRANDKRFPPWAWQLPNDQLAMMLGRLFACDAWVYLGNSPNSRNGGHTGISLASFGMIRDIEMAMLRLGIVGAVRAREMKLEGRLFPAWEWSCRDRIALGRMADVIDMPGKNEKLRALVEANARKTNARVRSWHKRNAPEGYRWEEVVELAPIPESGRAVHIDIEAEHTLITTLVEHDIH